LRDPRQHILPVVNLNIVTDQKGPMLPAITGTPISFLGEVKAELMRVTWPTRQEVIKLTVIVLVVSTALALYIGGLDAILTKVTDILIIKR
jgi:preprotein translocase subunit SecE